MVTVGPREKAIFCQTLAPLVKGLEGQDVLVEMRNDLVVFGRLDFCDCFMNLTLRDAMMIKRDGTPYYFEFFFLQRKNLRYVRIPNNISIPRLLKEKVDIATGKKAREARKAAVARRANFLKRKHEKNMGIGTLAPIVVENARTVRSESITDKQCNPKPGPSSGR